VRSFRNNALTDSRNIPRRRDRCDGPTITMECSFGRQHPLACASYLDPRCGVLARVEKKSRTESRWGTQHRKRCSLIRRLRCTWPARWCTCRGSAVPCSKTSANVVALGITVFSTNAADNGRCRHDDYLRALLGFDKTPRPQGTR
jgi:hypothetical protein